MFRLRCEISLLPLLDFTLHLSTRSLLGFLELTPTRTACMDPPPIASTSSSSLIPASSSAPNSSSTSSLPSTSQLPQDYSPYLLQPTSTSPLLSLPVETAHSPPCFGFRFSSLLLKRYTRLDNPLPTRHTLQHFPPSLSPSAFFLLNRTIFD